MESGSECASCGNGKMRVYCSKTRGNSQVRFLACKACGDKPAGNKQVVPREFVSKR